MAFFLIFFPFSIVHEDFFRPALQSNLQVSRSPCEKLDRRETVILIHVWSNIWSKSFTNHQKQLAWQAANK